MTVNNRNFADDNLFPVSIYLLYDGMEVQEDVYDADAVKLIIRRGTILRDGDLDRIRNLNAGRETICVSGNTYSNLLEKSANPASNGLWELEESTGYAETKDKTFDLLSEISKNKVVEQEALITVSAELSHRLEVTSPSIILSLINALAPVDEYLQRHCVNVGLLNGLFGQWIGLPKHEIDRLVLIGLLHDCGKALVPHQVLNAPRKLTITEFEVIKMHPVYSYELLSGFPEQVRRAVRLHHEKTNGTGYPDRLVCDNTPWEARITSITDVYDAIVSQRVYKRPRSPFNVMAFLKELSGNELDDGMVSVFIDKMPKELVDKQVVMSDLRIGTIRSYDPEDIEFPMVEVSGQVIKTNKYCYCTSMHIEEE